MSISRVCVGLVVVGLATGCSGKSESGGSTDVGGSSGSAGVAAAAGAPASAGTGGGGSDGGAGAAGESGAGGEAGASLGNEAGAAGSPETGGTAGSDMYPPIDIGAQQTAEKLDVLFVVDNSTTMADKQHILEASLPSFVNRLVNPRCVDSQGTPVAAQPASSDAECPSGSREWTPVKDMHLGVITTSIGGHGGSVCSMPSSPDEYLDDGGELLPSRRANLPSYHDAGYLAYDATGSAGVANLNSVISDLQTIVSAAGEHGCGYEAPLEAMYRFLVDPEPPLSIKQVNGQSVPDGINGTLLTQRNAFLRPDSAVAIVVLSDESDCSIRDDSVGWFVASQSRMPLATVACETNPNDSCCRSCATREISPPSGCEALSADANCKNVTTGAAYATSDPLHDSLNLRCFDQKRRFGFDLLYPLERYSNALSNPKIENRSHTLVDNPLFAARDGKGPRSATLVSVSLIVGAPWQDLATTESLASGHAIEYLDGAGLESNARWPLLLGDPKHNQPPTDPFMIESSYERHGSNPLTQTPIVAASSTNPRANAINGHEKKIPDLADLQFACTFALPTPKPCANNDSECDCAPDKAGHLDGVLADNSPLCQPPGGGAATSTQYYGKGYPGTRELGFAKLLGERAVPASICPITLTDTNSPDYAFNPAFGSLLKRIAKTLK